MALLTCTDLSIGYDGKTVVKDLNFYVNEGDFLCIVGENGSGKSTLMKTILGLEQPIAGKITTGEGLLRKQIGYLPQQTAVQKDFPASVREVVMSGFCGAMGLRPFYNDSEKKEAAKTLEMLGISDIAKRCYRELSGGQQQRVLLARALCATKKLLLLDEPVSGLDPKAAHEMYSIIDDLNRKSGITVIMISHDLVIGSNSSVTHVLELGKSVFFGTKSEYDSSGRSVFERYGGDAK